LTKDEVISVIKKHILENLEDIEEKDIDISKSMKEVGADSLDIIEVVSCSMRELNVKIPRTELSEINTIEGLADKLIAHLD
jgi:polyketide biosynthesis acyl carrier protein